MEVKSWLVFVLYISFLVGTLSFLHGQWISGFRRKIAGKLSLLPWHSYTLSILFFLSLSFFLSLLLFSVAQGPLQDCARGPGTNVDPELKKSISNCVLCVPNIGNCLLECAVCHRLFS